MDPTLAVLVVDDHSVFADALRSRLTAERDLYPVTVAYTVADALLKIQSSHVDVALLDYSLDDETGVSLAGAIGETSPETAVIMLSAMLSTDAVLDALSAGARAWVKKTTDTATLVRVIHRVHAGDMWLDQDTLAQVLPRLVDLAFRVQDDPLDVLTAREIEILRYMSEAVRRHEIAARLGISENTVRTHVQNLLGKLEVHSAVEAVGLMLRSARYRETP